MEPEKPMSAEEIARKWLPVGERMPAPYAANQRGLAADITALVDAKVREERERACSQREAYQRGYDARERAAFDAGFARGVEELPPDMRLPVPKEADHDEG